MKIKDGYNVRKMCGNAVVVAVPKSDEDFNGIINLNESGELLWNKLCGGAEKSELVELLVSEYDVDAGVAAKDVDEFVAKVEGAGLFE